MPDAEVMNVIRLRDRMTGNEVICCQPPRGPLMARVFLEAGYAGFAPADEIKEIYRPNDCIVRHQDGRVRVLDTSELYYYYAALEEGTPAVDLVPRPHVCTPPVILSTTPHPAYWTCPACGIHWHLRSEVRWVPGYGEGGPLYG